MEKVVGGRDHGLGDRAAVLGLPGLPRWESRRS